MKVIEKAKAKKKERDNKYKRAVEDNGKLRAKHFETMATVRKLEERIEDLEEIQEKYSKLLTWSISAENKIEELTKALEEMYD